MRRWMAACALVLAAHAARADDVVLRDMGSFHVGGKLVEITGRPERDVTFAPGGVPAHVDPNGTYMAGQMSGPSSVGDLSGKRATTHNRQRHGGVFMPRLGAVSPARHLLNESVGPNAAMMVQR